jgi:hypothetical protein
MLGAESSGLDGCSEQIYVSNQIESAGTYKPLSSVIADRTGTESVRKNSRDRIFKKDASRNE